MGLRWSNGDRVVVDPIIVGRNAEKMEALAIKHNITRWSTDIDAALKNPEDTIFFDAGSTQMRADLLKKAMDAGKHIYSEKPVSETLEVALNLARYAKEKGVKNGVVHDKLSLPRFDEIKSA